jgi:tetratricopeptide (TPR) repeat protein
LDSPAARSKGGWGWRGRPALLAALALLLPLAAAHASAANVMPRVSGTAHANVEAQRQALLKDMLADPSNVDLAMRYAELSAQAGDLEGAISTLERLAIFAPNVARLNFELGVLYYRLGAFDLATAYFNTASAAPDATADLKAQAAAYVTRGTAASASDRSMASLIFGARYQTNANSGAVNPFVNLNGVQFQLNSAAMADPDANGFVAATIHSTHDLASQGDRFDTDISLYGSLYDKHDELDTLAGEMHFGPVFDLGRFAIQHSTLGVYGIGTAVGLKGDPYLYALGAGAVLTDMLDPATQLRGRLEYRYETYFNSAIRPTVSDMTGPRTRATADLRHQLNDLATLYGSIYGERKSAVAGFNADWEAGGAAGVILRFAGPIKTPGGPWTLDLSAGGYGRIFDANDPTISSQPRQDKEAFVQGVLTIPFAESWAAVASLGYARQWSSYDLYSYDNVSTSLAVMKNF